MRLIKLLLAALLLASLVVPITSQLSAHAQSGVSRFESAECDFTVPSGQTVECGYLVVPENRDDPDSRSIKLHVGIFKSPNPNAAPDPIVYLEGGPGGSALKNMELAFALYFAPFVANRDLVVMDQRGTGHSKPALDCPEFTEVAFDQLDEALSPEESLSEQAAALFACRDRLLKEAELSAYNSRENAADFNDLRLALGYQEWNLLGISYGTRLGLTIMRDFPQGVRSVVLDSSYPLQEDLYQNILPNFDRALRRLFEDCRTDPSCNAAYPDLENVFYQTADQLNAQPVPLQGTLPFSGEQIDILLTGDALIGLTFQLLYVTDAIPSLPQIIYAAHDGDFGLLLPIYMSILQNVDLVSIGMQLAVQCSEEIPFSDFDQISAQEQAYPKLGRFFRSSINLSRAMLETCALWNPAAPDPIENEPVRSDIPTLILAGEYDPITPPAWGQLLQQDLPNSTFLQFPATGHGVSITGECPAQIVNSFFDDPAAPPDVSCMDQLSPPAFASPSEEAVTLVPFTDTTFGYTSVHPEGWQELAPGTFARSALGDAVVAQVAMPGIDAATALDLISSQLGLEGLLESSGEVAANGLNWQLYRLEIQNLVVDLAVTGREGGTYMILLQTLPAENQSLRESIFLPTIDAFVPQ